MPAYDRDLIGYGPNPPDPKWPNGARLAVNFVMNYEEGSEPSVQDGEGFTEIGLTESHGLNQAGAGRDLGWRWIKHFELSEDEEREQIRKAVQSLTATIGERPLGWYCRYAPSVNTRRLVVEEGGFLYDSDYYGDELPFWKTVSGKPHLIIPYSLTNNDGKYAGWTGTSDEWFAFIRVAFDVLYDEGATRPKMMSVELHMRLIGHPARAAGLQRLLDYMQQRDRVWFTRRIDIARHWIASHPYPGKGLNE